MPYHLVIRVCRVDSPEYLLRYRSCICEGIRFTASQITRNHQTEDRLPQQVRGSQSVHEVLFPLQNEILHVQLGVLRGAEHGGLHRLNGWHFELRHRGSVFADDAHEEQRNHQSSCESVIENRKSYL